VPAPVDGPQQSAPQGVGDHQGVQEDQPVRVLDVRAGTGIARSLLPDPERSIWLDEDRAKLPRVQASAMVTTGILAAATRLLLRDRSIDVALCLAMSHHLSDPQLETMLSEIARVVHVGEKGPEPAGRVFGPAQRLSDL
jgi:ubiquinone/menaquinone biosynthesis C-methylase UbiE